MFQQLKVLKTGKKRSNDIANDISFMIKLWVYEIYNVAYKNYILTRAIT